MGTRTCGFAHCGGRSPISKYQRSALAIGWAAMNPPTSRPQSRGAVLSNWHITTEANCCQPSFRAGNFRKLLPAEHCLTAKLQSWQRYFCRAASWCSFLWPRQIRTLPCLMCLSQASQTGALPRLCVVRLHSWLDHRGSEKYFVFVKLPSRLCRIPS